MTTAAPERELAVRIKLRRGNWRAYTSTARELYIEGPARTGKTFGALLSMNRNAQTYPGYRGLIVRKVAVTLGTSVLRTLEEDVYHDWDSYGRSSQLDGVSFFGGSAHEPQAYVYANGSRIVVGGMDNPLKVLGSEYDQVLYNELIEGNDEEVETLLSRLSHGVLPQPQFIGDTNPGHDKSWLLKRILRGGPGVEYIKTTLKDNPAFYDDDGEPTERGRAYIESLSGLTGSRYQRLVLGEWVGVENAIYETFDRRQQVVDLEPGLTWSDSALGSDYGRVHKAAGIALTRDQYGRIWVREAWGQPDLENGETTATQSARLIHQYKLRKIGGDPNQDPLIGLIKSKAGRLMASVAEGARQHRIDLTSRYMRSFTGGAVPSKADEMAMRWPVPEPGRPDSYGLLFVKGAPGIEELCDQIEAYHYEHRLTDTRDEMVVARIDEDLVAGMENGIWALDELTISSLPMRATVTRNVPQPLKNPFSKRPPAPAPVGMRRSN